MLKRTTRVTAIAAAGLIAMAGPALAHDGFVEDGAIDNAKATHGHDAHAQHGGDEGHIDVENYGTELVSKLELSRVTAGKIADVAVYGNYAYLAAWGGETCKDNGVHVVDISDVEKPREVAFVPSKEGSYPGEGVQVTRIATPSFTGEVLVTNNEICKGKAGFGGINIYDVRNPARPTPLAVGFGDDSGNNEKKTAHQTHSVFAWADGAKAYAVMVDNEEAEDVDIVDITNPKKPAIIAEYDLMTLSGEEIAQEGLDEIFLHDMVVKEIDGKQIMLASYWDGGYVQLDVSEPTKAVYLNDSDFAPVDPKAPGGVRPEGNAHQAEYTLDNKFVLAADEDFSPFALIGRNDTDGTDVTASQGSDTRKLGETETLTGEARFGGRACTQTGGDADVPPGDGTQIAVVERGFCTFTEKVAAVEAAGGYAAVFVFNRPGSDACNGSLGMSVSGNIPAFGVAPREQGYAIFGKEALYDDAACLAGGGAPAPIALGETGDTLTFSSYFDGWGYVHLFDRESMEDLDTYAIPEAHDIEYADGRGDMSVHEVATSLQNPNLAYLSYYAGGLRVIDISSGQIEEVGAFIDEGGNNFWGVEAFERGDQEYVALSDRDFGLYIMKVAP